MKKNVNWTQYQRKLRIPAFFAMIAALVLFIAFFFPYASATNNYVEYLKLDSVTNTPIASYTKLTYGDMINVSLFELTEFSFQEWEAIKTEIWYVAIFGAIAVCALGILLSAKCRWPVMIILFSGLAALDFYLLPGYFKESVIGSGGDWVRGLVYPLFYPAAALAAFNGLVMLWGKSIINVGKPPRPKK